MDLTVDIGNTATKLGLFRKNKLLSTHILRQPTHQKIVQFGIKRMVNNIIISSVNNNVTIHTQRLKPYFENVIELTHELKLPLTLNYKTPSKLGKDRIAAAVGGAALFPDQNLLVIDAGSAITFDVVTSEGTFLGGNISPGLQMRFRALNEFTNQLPLLRKQETTPTFGKNTSEAMLAGVQNGIIFEIDRYIEIVQTTYTLSQIIMTGGDSKFFDNKLKYPIFAEPNLTSFGLYKILKHNIYEL